jgi:hypothetical protein
VSKNHIDALVYWIGKTECLAGIPSAQGLGADEIGQVLWRENHRSVNIRYGRHDGTPEYHYSKPVTTEATKYYQAFDPESVQHAYQQVECYDYQTCESSDWESTTAFEWVSALSKVLETAGAREVGTSRHPAIPWGV